MKNTRFRDFSRVGRKNGCATNEKGGRKGPVSRQKPHPPFLCSIRLSRGGVGRSASVRGSPFGRGGGRKSGNGGSKARNDSRLWRVGSGSEDISSSPFHPVVDPDRRRVRWPSVGRRGKNGWTETAVSSPTPPTWQDRRPCLLPNYERERIRRASSPSRKRERRAEMPWDDAGREGGGAR